MDGGDGLVYGFRLQHLLLPLPEQRHDVLVAERFRLVDGSVAPAVLGIVRDAAVLEQEPHTLEVSLGAGQMERRAAIVVGEGDVHAGQFVTPQGRNVTDGCREQQVHHRKPLGLVAMAAWKLNTSTSSLQNCTPRQLLPSGSSGGDHINMPITFGMTSITPPQTPDFAGRPTLNANWPLKSYMPQECISDRTSRTFSDCSTRSSVSGQMPPLARVAATTESVSQVASIEQIWNTSSLKLRPLGSWPMYWCTTCAPSFSSAIAYVSGLLQLCSVNGTEVSPIENRWPSIVHTLTPQ
uniref:Uncharacterized protein n=1 Tax=Anopheles atroparvus TaxID=41427 RepID=A0A182IZQ3_ANOAO